MEKKEINRLGIFTAGFRWSGSSAVSDWLESFSAIKKPEGCEAAYDEKFVRFWVHAEHLLVDGAKMSKSKGNMYTLRDLLDKGYSPRAIRYLLSSVHYKKQLNFTFDGLKQADQALERIDNLLFRLNDIKDEIENNKNIPGIISKMFNDFIAAVDDDLNASRGLGVFFEFVNEINTLISENKISKQNNKEIISAIEKIDTVFGFIFLQTESDESEDNTRIEKLVQERNDARKNKNFQRSDEIRDLLLKEEIIIEDTKDGTRWRKKK